MSTRPDAYRPLVAIFAVFVGLVAVSAAVLFVRKLGTSPAAVASFYLGSQDAFTQPRSLRGLMFVAVQHLLALPLTLFVLAHLLGWAGRVRRHAAVVPLTFGVALAGVLAGFGVRFVWPQLAVVKLAAFVGFEVLLLWWVGMLGLMTLRWEPKS